MNKQKGGQDTELYFEQQEAEVLDESGMPELLNNSVENQYVNDVSLAP